MKKKAVLIIALLSIIMIWCSSIKIENTLVEDGKTELESNNYTQAMKTLSSALEEDNSNENARAMYMQAMKMRSVDNYIDKNNYKKAIDELKTIEKIKNGSSIIREKASKLLKDLEEKYEQEQKLAQERKENAKTVASNNANKVNQQILKEEEAKKVEEENQQQEQESLENNNFTDDDIQNSTNQVEQSQEEVNIQEEINIVE